MFCDHRGSLCQIRVVCPMIESLAVAEPSGAPVPSGTPRPLSEADAVEIWIARWLRVRRKDLIERYGCDPRQLYAIWWGERFPGSRRKAEDTFRIRHPGLVDRVSFGYRRIPRGPMKEPEGQLSLFE
jgi:hypothetical protein